MRGREHGGEITAGAFERASGGTLVIDGISDLTDVAQRILLGIIEDGQFTRVGGSAPVKVDARLFATADADFEALVETGQLRRDLVAQLGTLSLRVPPLREYSEDVPELLEIVPSLRRVPFSVPQSFFMRHLQRRRAYQMALI